MKNKQENFWRGFTWQRFVKHVLILLVLLFASDVISAWMSKENIAAIFTTKLVIKRSVISLLLGFFITIWYEPAFYKEEEEKTRA